MSLSKDLADALTQDARLFSLKELSKQTDGRLNVLLLQRVLSAYGFNRSQEWVETQLRKLEELGAVELIESEVIIASITRSGRDHLKQRTVIAGVTRPAEVE